MKLRNVSFLLVLLVAFSLLPTVTSCHNVCLQTAAQRGSAKLLIDDAQISLDQASSVVMALPDGSRKDDAKMYLDATRASLRTSTNLLEKAERMCSAPDVSAIFAPFAEAWQMLEPFLRKMGGASAESQVPEPIVVGIIR